MVKQNRFASWALWLAVAALIAFVVKEWIGYEIPKWDEFVNLLLTALTLLGIINNPTDKKHI